MAEKVLSLNSSETSIHMEYILGSLMDAHNPEDEYRDNSGNLIVQWKFRTDNPLVTVFVVKKRFMTFKDKVNSIIEKFSGFFPTKIIEDAKRISFDLDEKQKMPHSVSMMSLYLACQFHNHEINPYRLSKYIKETFKKTWFGDNITISKRLLSTLRQDMNRAIEMLGAEKFETLKSMWRKLDEQDEEANGEMDRERVGQAV